MDFAELLKALQEELETNSRAVPFSAKRMVDCDKCLDIVDEMIDAFPTELLQAKKVMAERQRYLDDARGEAERVTREAQIQAETYVTEHYVVQEANKRAEQILAEAEAQAHEARASARAYSEDLLRELEEYTKDCLEEVRQNRTKFKANQR